MKHKTADIAAALRGLATVVDEPNAAELCKIAANRLAETCALLAESTAWAQILARQLRHEGWVDADFHDLRQGLGLEEWGED